MTAKALAHPASAGHSSIKTFFEAELATYIDINADLNIAGSKLW